MTNEEARAYFINCNERIISVAKDENIYNYETKQIEDIFMRRTFEANESAIKALAQKPCDNEYIKVPKNALKYRTAGIVAYNAEWLKNHFDIERAVICGAQQPRDDCISRQAVLGMQYRIDDSATLSTRDVVNVDDIEDSPSVTPQPKTGHWIGDGNYICSCCKRDPLDFLEPCGLDGGSYMDTPMKYCPNCGAKMQEVEE